MEAYIKKVDVCEPICHFKELINRVILSVLSVQSDSGLVENVTWLDALNSGICHQLRQYVYFV